MLSIALIAMVDTILKPKSISSVDSKVAVVEMRHKAEWHEIDLQVPVKGGRYRIVTLAVVTGRYAVLGFDGRRHAPQYWATPDKGSLMESIVFIAQAGSLQWEAKR